MNIDKRGILEEQPFSYKIAKEKLFIYYNNKRIKTLKGKDAKFLIEDLEESDDFSAQLILAKVTKNFKRGNERNVNGKVKRGY